MKIKIKGKSPRATLRIAELPAQDGRSEHGRTPRALRQGPLPTPPRVMQSIKASKIALNTRRARAQVILENDFLSGWRFFVTSRR